MYYLLNLGSLIFGIIALAIPIIMITVKKVSLKNAAAGIYISLLSSLISLFMQILYTKHLVDIEDWSALMDTQGAVVLAALGLIIVAAVLNGIFLYRSLKYKNS